jgi:hypothetical protein
MFSHEDCRVRIVRQVALDPRDFPDRLASNLGVMRVFYEHAEARRA